MRPRIATLIAALVLIGLIIAGCSSVNLKAPGFELTMQGPMPTLYKVVSVGQDEDGQRTFDLAHFEAETTPAPVADEEEEPEPPVTP